MLTRSVFWTALAAMFLGLAVVTFRGRREVRQALSSLGPVINPPPDPRAYTFTPEDVAKALASILTAELVGFVLAAVAALYEALT